MNGKLAVKVALDLEGRSASIVVRGRVDVRNVQALYSLAHRANSLNPGYEITLNLGAATAEQEVLDALQAYASLGHLPRHVDPGQAECRLRIKTGELAQQTKPDMTLAV
jgi:hypothetical protein